MFQAVRETLGLNIYLYAWQKRTSVQLGSQKEEKKIEEEKTYSFDMLSQ